MKSLMTSASDKFDYLQLYLKEIESGKYIIGEWMKKNIQFISTLLDSGKVYYVKEKADKMIRFMENQTCYVEGRNGKFVLETWQKYIIACVFGLMDPDGYRHFNEVVVLIGRKQGKSTMMASLETGVAYSEPEIGMQIYNCAPKLKQANIIFNQVLLMIDKNPVMRRLGKKRRNDYYIKSKNCTIEPLAFNSKKSDGFNPYFTCFDEFAAWEGSRGKDMYNVMMSAQGGRRDPINVACSTANFVDGGLYDELMMRCTNVLNGTSEEEALLPFIYMIDDESKWDDVEELKKALPNLGVSFFEKNLRQEILKAKASANYKQEFLTKYANLKQNSTAAWLQAKDVKNSQSEEIKPEDFSYMYAIGGVDLSQTTDLTSACCVIPYQGKYYVLSHFWIPSKRLQALSERDNINYSEMIEYGHLSTSGEDFVDYKDVTKWFENLRDNYHIQFPVIGYDRYSSTYFVDEMMSKGFTMDWVHQGTNLTPVIHEFEGMLGSSQVKTGTNGLLQTHMMNAALQRNTVDKRVRLVKSDARKHIDGVAAVLDAFTVKSKWNSAYQWCWGGNVKRELAG